MTDVELAALWQEFANAYGWDSLEAYQKFFGLMESGALDLPTEEVLTARRCGVRDNLAVIAEAKWQKKVISYHTEKHLPGMPHAEQDNAVDAALASWAEHCDLKFQRVLSIARADVIFSTGHGRADGFDGPSGILAWMQLGTNNDNPILGCFDDQEPWSLSPGQDVYFPAVVAHEFGHALNLVHDRDPNALMYAIYHKHISKPQRPDIARVQALYGPPPTPTPTPVPGGFMREIVDLIVTALVAYIKQTAPFLGRFLEGQKDRIVDFIIRRFGLGLQQPALMDMEGLASELVAEIGVPPPATMEN